LGCLQPRDPKLGYKAPTVPLYQVQHQDHQWEPPVPADLHLFQVTSALQVSVVTVGTHVGAVTVPPERACMGQPGARKSSQPSSSLGSGGTSVSYNEGKLSQALDQPLPTQGHLKHGSRTKLPVNNSLFRAVKNVQYWVHKLNSKLLGHFPFNFPNLLKCESLAPFIVFK